jgi:hypothetical protein
LPKTALNSSSVTHGVPTLSRFTALIVAVLKRGDLRAFGRARPAHGEVVLKRPRVYEPDAAGEPARLDAFVAAASRDAIG